MGWFTKTEDKKTQGHKATINVSPGALAEKNAPLERRIQRIKRLEAALENCDRLSKREQLKAELAAQVDFLEQSAQALALIKSGEGA